ncbi:MAG: beta-propeller fold lactonase family protein [Alphaproteobacteria bacterium]|nr:beta-propeller fold lactonase family protein [Alphaproteobacteria bacterium]
MNNNNILFAIVIVIILAVGAYVYINNSSTHSSSKDGIGGYIYTSLNGQNGTDNKIIKFERLSDGSLGAQTNYRTLGKGGANISAGGDAHGDFDAQEAISIIDKKYLLVANAGSNDITVFNLDSENGNLSNAKVYPSKGTRPVSIAYTKKSDGNYWVVVGNQWNNPNKQKGGVGEAPIERYPNDAFFTNTVNEILQDRNISLFTFDKETGALSFEKVLDTYSGINGGPTTVAFNRTGKKLAVTTWGVAHFNTASPSLKEQLPGRVYVYDFQDGSVENEHYFEEKGISGSIGFAWSTKSDHIYVSNFNLTKEKRDAGNSVTVLLPTKTGISKVQNFATGTGDIDEACWVYVDKKNDRVLVSSFGANWISTFKMNGNGTLSKIGSDKNTTYTKRAASVPNGDTKDLFVAEGKYLYAAGAFQTYTIGVMHINKDGSLTQVAEVPVKDATNKQGPGSYNFLGLVGFDL